MEKLTDDFTQYSDESEPDYPARIAQLQQRIQELECNVGIAYKDGYMKAIDEQEEIRARIKELEAALRVIAGLEQCLDNKLGNAEIARIALEKGR